MTSSPMLTCPRCQRHIHRNERCCPFCGERGDKDSGLGAGVILGSVLAATLLAATLDACSASQAAVYGPAPRSDTDSLRVIPPDASPEIATDPDAGR